jgi:predicted nucleic acid-binding protein
LIFVDTNVYTYAVGRQHPQRATARRFFEKASAEGMPLVTSAEVLQELLHAYLPVGRLAVLDDALRLVEGTSIVWPVEPQDVRYAREIVPKYPALGARDLLHLASCRRRSVTEIKTYDKALGAAFRA